MASLTAEKILASYLTDQRNILLDLNKLSEPPLTTQGKYPDKDRHQYCESVINVIKQYLRAEYVSIFYRNPSTLFESVNCLASTGLYDAAGNLLTADELPAAQYWRHESLTGAVYATGRPQIFKMGRDYGRDKPKFRETPLGFPERSVSAIIYPIISALPDAQTLGVIRCTDCRDTLFQTQPANFNPGHAYVLDFISKQIAPVLETLATRLARETNISVVKHDLDTAVGRVRNSVFTVGLHLLKQGLVRNSETTLNLLRDTFQERSAYNAFIAGLEESLSHERLAETVEEGMLDEYKLPDLLLSCLKLHRLVSSLDPLDGLPYSPMPTYLEGDIVARVAAIWRRDFLVEKGIMLLYRPFKDVIPKLYVDRVLIERALENLLSNALKYGDRGTTVNIEPRAEPSGYFITVSSRGIEIEDCERDLIFTPGYRGKKAKERGFGLGIGLKVSRRIMEQHGGRLDLLSHRNPVTFGMFFPSKLRMMTK
jgi:signal transduction histidine kinase